MPIVLLRLVKNCLWGSSLAIFCYDDFDFMDINVQYPGLFPTLGNVDGLS